MRKIAAEAGMGAMTLYRYFPSKIELLHHIWGEFFIELFERILASQQAQIDARQRFRQACHAYLDYWFANPDRFRMVYLNEDRAESNNRFFVHHARIEEQFNAVFAPSLSEAFPDKNAAEMTFVLQGVLCHMNGIALNLITISEYHWPGHKPLLDDYLDHLLKP